jgi:hypothetical protein
MKFLVTFKERTGADGQPSEDAPDEAALEIPDGVILDRTFVQRTVPDAMHNEEVLDEDDDFLSLSAETWEYDIADGRQQEFLDAVKVSETAMECVPLDDDSDPNL